MNNSIVVSIGGIVLLFIIFFGTLFLHKDTGPSGPSNIATSTPTVVTNDITTPTTSTQVHTASSPVATTLPTVTASNLSAAVVGTVVPNGAFTTYWFEYGTSQHLGVASAAQSLGSGFESLAAPYYITGLAKDTMYYYRLVAQNSFGKSTGQIFTFRTTVGPVTIEGSTPTVKTEGVNTITTTSATVTGHVNPNKAPTTYWFEYGKNKELGFIVAVEAVGNGGVSLPATALLQGLEPGTTYFYRLSAQNTFGTVGGSILSFKTSGQKIVAVPVVTTQLASPFATTTATLRGTVNPYGTQSSYWFEYSTSATFANALKTTSHRSAGGGTTTVAVMQDITGLKGATTYYFRTVAQNNNGTVKGATQSFRTK